MKSKHKGMIGRIFLGIIILTILVIIIIPKPQKVNISTSPSITQTQQKKVIIKHTVNLTSKGFEPESITVKKGEMIIWTNNSGQKASVSSADYPTHKKFRFLNIGQFSAGSSIESIMRTAGNFQYVNHFNPTQTGTITVTE